MEYYSSLAKRRREDTAANNGQAVPSSVLSANAKDEEEDIIKAISRYRKKEAGKVKAKETREKNKNTIRSLEKKLLPSQYRKYKTDTKGMSISKRIEYLKKNK